MRRIALLVVVLIALLFLWIFEARHFSLLLDRFGTAELESRAIDHIEYDGSESAGVFEIAGSPFSTQGVNNKPFPLTLEADPQKHFVISTNGKSFLLGRASSRGKLQITPDSSDHVALNVRRSWLSWPTPFEINFMTGHSPSWKRNLYYQIRWQKPSGQKLEMVWRYEQYFYPGDGWTNGFMTREGATGLIRVEISP
jgi:hypothetical protein